MSRQTFQLTVHLPSDFENFSSLNYLNKVFIFAIYPIYTIGRLLQRPEDVSVGFRKIQYADVHTMLDLDNVQLKTDDNTQVHTCAFSNEKIITQTRISNFQG